ncbi:MAG: Flp pilus assembly complex ATPase component TadA, partial [Bdellovibrionales bacterium]|nr:Flp pilus assembly complex ATPase component TadA [Bdellovibrionales bacterium]
MKGTTMNHNAHQSLVRFLVKLNLLSMDQASVSYTPAEGNPISYFADRGYFTQDQAIQAVAKKLDIPIVPIDFDQLQKSAALIENPRLSKIAPDRWQSIEAIPVSLSGTSLLIAMANPLDYDARTALEFDLSCAVDVAIAQESELKGVLASLDGISVSQELREIFEASEDSEATLISTEDDDSNVDENPDAAPVIRLVNKIFFEAVHSGGSDIHITPQKDKVNVRVRVDGIMKTLFTVPPRFQKALTSRIKLLAKMDISESRQPQDGRIKIKTSHGVKDLRVSTVPAMYGENIVARV